MPAHAGIEPAIRCRRSRAEAMRCRKPNYLLIEPGGRWGVPAGSIHGLFSHTSSLMKAARLALLLFAYFSFAAHADDWKSYDVDPDAAVELPGEPVTTTQGNANVVAYRGTVDGSPYALTVLTFDTDGRIQDQGDVVELYDGVVDGAREKVKGSMRIDRAAAVQGIPARRYLLETAEGIHIDSLSIYKDDHLYTFAVSTLGVAPKPIAEKFFGSIQFRNKAAGARNAGTASEGASLTAFSQADDGGARRAGYVVGYVLGALCILAIPTTIIVLLVLARSRRRNRA